MDTIDVLEFLKYGAIGIALALAVLSYRLLSKEQDQESVRPAMLKTIKVYFLMAVALSALFAGAEIYTSLHRQGNNSTAELDDLHRFHLPDNRADTTAMLKKNAITNLIKRLETENNALATDNKAKVQNDFYSRVSTLMSQVGEFGNSINLYYEAENKQEVFDVLNEIFMHLELCNARIETCEAVAEEWVRLKSSWADSGQQYIKISDISSLVVRYLRLQDGGSRQSAPRRTNAAAAS